VVDVEEGALNMVIADLEAADPHVEHVAVGTRDTGLGMDALIPHLELRVLGKPFLLALEVMLNVALPAEE
jgi:hypothetical protein